jgi:hypothetical protein
MTATGTPSRTPGEETARELLAVTQADREAAAAFYGPHLARPGEVPVTAHMRAGKIDESPLIQAFARHRLATLSREAVAEAVHRGRFPAGQEPTPFQDEDRRGREYCFRIADQIISLIIGRARTPAAEWREKGEPDPHGNSYDCERAELLGGHLTDDQVAFETAMLMRTDLNHEAVLQTAKDRIRWLSRKLVIAAALPEALATIANGAANGLAEFKARLGDRKAPTWHAVNALQDNLAACQGTARTALQDHQVDGK